MSIRRIQHLAFTCITLATLAVVAFMGTSPAIDCTNPAIWGTETGVQHCAINGGK